MGSSRETIDGDEVRERSPSERLREQLLVGIREGRWRAGDPLPSERQLTEDYGVSRVAVRESLSQLHGLGIIDRSQGRRARVQHLDAKALGRLFPVMLAHDGVKTHGHVFEVRAALEPRTAALAAIRRTDEDIARIDAAVAEYGQSLGVARPPNVERDFAIHRAIAEAAKNPILPSLMDAIAGFMLFAQKQSCGDDPVRLRAADGEHRAIADAIRRGDPERAQLEMGYHLQRSADRIREG